MNTNKLEIPRKYPGNEKLSNAYQLGFNRGSGFAACNVPTLGETVLTEGMGQVTVDAENIREVHLDSCWAAESNNRQYSPFEFIASEFNGADDEDGEHCAYFGRFTLTMTLTQANNCSHQGQCDEDVSYWATRIERPEDCTVEALAKELAEYGAWNDEELADDEANWKRIIWSAAGNILEEHASTDSLWEAFDAGTSDAIHADLEGYSDADYGIESSN